MDNPSQTRRTFLKSGLCSMAGLGVAGCGFGTGELLSLVATGRPEYNVSQDSFGTSSFPNNNYGTESFLVLGYSNTGVGGTNDANIPNREAFCHGFLEFSGFAIHHQLRPVQTFPFEGEIASAKLILTAYHDAMQRGDARVNVSLLQPFNESTITYSNQPAKVQGVQNYSAHIPRPNHLQKLELDVTQLVNISPANETFVISPSGRRGNMVSVYSREGAINAGNPDYAPRLEVQWNEISITQI